MKKIICLILVIATMFALVACGGAKKLENGKKYVAVSCEMLGYEMSVEDIYKGEFSITLGDNGAASCVCDGASESMTYTLNGTEFHAKGKSVEFNGKLENDIIKVEDLLGTGMSMTFELVDAG